MTDKPATCPPNDCDFEQTDGLIDRDGFETRRCCNCGETAEFQVYDPNECDPQDVTDRGFEPDTEMRYFEEIA